MARRSSLSGLCDSAIVPQSHTKSNRRLWCVLTEELQKAWVKAHQRQRGGRTWPVRGYQRKDRQQGTGNRQREKRRERQATGRERGGGHAVRGEKRSGQRGTAGSTEGLEPAEDYRLNGVKARAFKAWFGPWDTDPARASQVVDRGTGEPKETYNIPGQGSVVRDEGGKPLVVYHGTAWGGFTAFDRARQDPEALFGPGFYFTEDRAVADSYWSKEKPRTLSELTEAERKSLVAAIGDELKERGLNRKMRWIAEAVLDLFAHNGDPNVLMVLGEEPFSVEYDSDEFLQQAGVAANLRTPETKACYLNIRKPFDADNPTAEQARALVEAEAERLGYWTKGQIEANLRRAREDPKSLFPLEVFRSPSFQRWLRAEGYDGITHIGGQRMGKLQRTGGKRHRVWIAFEPTQVKAVENRGTFDPGEEDMYKAVGRGRLWVRISGA